MVQHRLAIFTTLKQTKAIIDTLKNPKLNPLINNQIDPNNENRFKHQVGIISNDPILARDFIKTINDRFSYKIDGFCYRADQDRNEIFKESLWTIDLTNWQLQDWLVLVDRCVSQSIIDFVNHQSHYRSWLLTITYDDLHYYCQKFLLNQHDPELVNQLLEQWFKTIVAKERPVIHSEQAITIVEIYLELANEQGALISPNPTLQPAQVETNQTQSEQPITTYQEIVYRP